MDGFSSNKRFREEGGETPEAKRLRADLFLCILEEDDVGAGERFPASQDLETVIRSLEVEIGLSPDQAPAEEIVEGKQMEIGYLLEASDDELGLPPPEKSSPEAAVELLEEFGQIWGFEEDGVPAWYEGFSEFGSLPEKFVTAEDGGAAVAFSLDGGLFDLSEFCLRPVSLPVL